MIPRYDFGPSKLLFVVKPSERGQELQQHIDLLTEAELKNLCGNFSTADYNDPDLEDSARPFEHVFVCGHEATNKFVNHKTFGAVKYKEFFDFGKKFTVIDSINHLTKRSKDIIRAKIQDSSKKAQP